MRQKILIISILTLFLLSMAGVGQETYDGDPFDSLKDIRILKSTRSDVESVLGGSTIEGCYICRYESNGEATTVVYATDYCKGDLPGWNVPKDTVLSYYRFPKFSLALSNESLEKLNFQLSGSDIFDDDSGYYYSNLELGIQIEKGLTEKIGYVKHLPTSEDDYMRCDGFPPFNPVSEIYYPNEVHDDSSLEFGQATLESMVVEMSQNPEGYRGYFVVYQGVNQEPTQFEEYLTDLQSFLHSLEEEDSRVRISIIDAGCLETFKIETFIIPENWMPPVPKRSTSVSSFQKLCCH